MQYVCCNIFAVAFLSYLTYSDIKSIYLLLLICILLHTANEKSTSLILHYKYCVTCVKLKFSPVHDFRVFIQPTVNYNARNRTFSNFVAYGQQLVIQ